MSAADLQKLVGAAAKDNSARIKEASNDIFQYA
jgi:hypothetical protein